MFVAAALTGGVYFLEFGRQSGKAPTASSPTVSSIFGFGESEVQGLTVTKAECAARMRALS